MAETAEETVVETTTPTAPLAPASGKTLDELQAELNRVETALKQVNKESAERRKKLEAFEKAEDERQKAALSETDRLKQELAQTSAKLEASQRAELQRSVADEVGLPAPFAARIVGAEHDAMLADAQTMFEALPKTGTPQIPATNPGGASKGETDEQKRKRLGLR